MRSTPPTCMSRDKRQAVMFPENLGKVDGSLFITAIEHNGPETSFRMFNFILNDGRNSNFDFLEDRNQTFNIPAGN